MNGQISFETSGLIVEERNEVIDMSEYISGSKAMQMLELSRHTFEKIVKEELINPTIVAEKKVYSVASLEEFMKTEKY